MKKWIEVLEQAIHDRRWQRIIELLEEEKTKHAGTAPAQTKRKAIKTLLKNIGKEPETLWNAALYFGASSSPTAKEVSAHLLPELFADYPEESSELLHTIADDENWEVREWAAGGCGEILAKHFKDFYPVVDCWKEDPSENIRRAAVLTLMYASKTLDDTHASQLLKVLEPLMADQSEYVKKNLGAFAIGDGLLKRYPSQVLIWLDALVYSEDEQVRWNVAMVFTAAAARSFYKEGEKLLKVLETDERKSIQRAVNKARGNLEKARLEV